MIKVNKLFVDYVCGKKNNVDVGNLRAEIMNKRGQSIELKTNKMLPTFFGLTDVFSVNKNDFDKWFVTE